MQNNKGICHINIIPILWAGVTYKKKKPTLPWCNDTVSYIKLLYNWNECIKFVLMSLHLNERNEKSHFLQGYELPLRRAAPSILAASSLQGGVF